MAARKRPSPHSKAPYVIRVRFPGLTKMDEITGGSPYGGSTLAGADGSRQRQQARRCPLAITSRRSRQSWSTFIKSLEGGDAGQAGVLSVATQGYCAAWFISCPESREVRTRSTVSGAGGATSIGDRFVNTIRTATLNTFVASRRSPQRAADRPP